MEKSQWQQALFGTALIINLRKRFIDQLRRLINLCQAKTVRISIMMIQELWIIKELLNDVVMKQ